MSFITSIGTSVPSNQFHQTEIADFMVQAMQLSGNDSRKLHTIFRKSGIKTRHSVLEDYGRNKNFTFYPNTKDFEPFPSTPKRLEEFQKHALQLSVRAIKNCVRDRPKFKIQNITHLIVVSCTGLYAPGLDIDLIKELGLPTDVQRTCINFMGCYAAFNALKIGDSICKSNENAKVLIVCTELCSLHFQKIPTDDNLLANALFADGAAALLMEPEMRKGLNFKPEVFHNALAINGIEHMSWAVGNVGFEMKLSSYVPDVIQKGIKTLTSELLKKIDQDAASIKYFAIHPGGKKILEVIEKELELTKKQTAPAHHVLAQYGNMSSPTVLFVLKEIVDTLTAKDHDQSILSFAFGPGLTLESMLLRIHHN